MARCRNSDICSNPDSVTELNRCAIQKCTFVVYKAALSKVDIHTILTVKWCKNECTAILCGWYHFLQNTLLTLLHPNRCAVEFVAQTHSSFMVARYVCAVCIVELSRSHSVPIVHVVSPDVSYKTLQLTIIVSSIFTFYNKESHRSHLTVQPATFYKNQFKNQ